MRPDQAYTIVKQKKHVRHTPLQIEHILMQDQRQALIGAIAGVVQADGIENRQQLPHRIPDEWRQKWPRLWGR